MTISYDFLSAVKAGQAAASEAENNRREIQEVLDALNGQLSSVSPGHKLAVARTTGTKPLTS